MCDMRRGGGYAHEFVGRVGGECGRHGEEEAVVGFCVLNWSLEFSDIARRWLQFIDGLRLCWILNAKLSLRSAAHRLR